MQQPVLQVNQCSFAFQGTGVLCDASLTLYPGEFAALIGVNGAGKSTLLRLVIGELPLQAGEILLFGTPVQRFRDWPRIGYVPQNTALHAAAFPATVSEVVSAGLYAHSGLLRPVRHREKISWALDQVEMSPCAGKLIGKLSGGQLQRVLIARALVGRPEILLLDEPTAGVDAEHAVGLYHLLRRLHREQGHSVLMVTHDAARAIPFLDRCFQMEGGEILEIHPQGLSAGESPSGEAI